VVARRYKEIDCTTLDGNRRVVTGKLSEDVSRDGLASLRKRSLLGWGKSGTKLERREDMPAGREVQLCEDVG
jgi:hypothetical protein